MNCLKMVCVLVLSLALNSRESSAYPINVFGVYTGFHSCAESNCIEDNGEGAFWKVPGGRTVTFGACPSSIYLPNLGMPGGVQCDLSELGPITSIVTTVEMQHNPAAGTVSVVQPSTGKELVCFTQMQTLQNARVSPNQDRCTYSFDPITNSQTISDGVVTIVDSVTP